MVFSAEEFWLGLDAIYNITNESPHSLKIYIETPEPEVERAEVRYDSFRLTENAIIIRPL